MSDPASTSPVDKDYARIIIACIVSFGFIGLLVCLLFVAIPSQSAPILMAMLGVLAASTNSLINFYFGSSQSSASKDLMLYNSVPSNAVSTVEPKK